MARPSHPTEQTPVSARRGTNLPRLKNFNESVVLDSLRRAPDGLSRVELATASGLSAQTVSNICRRLIDQGVILDEGTVVPSAAGVGGKRRTLLHLNPDAYYAIGVHLDPAVATVAVLNVTGAVLAERRHPMHDVTEPDRVLADIARLVSELIESAKLPRDRILGLGVAAPGPIDLDSGVIIDPPQLRGWGRVPVRDRLAELTGLPVILDKDVTAAVIAERWAAGPAAADVDTFVFFYIGTGSGMGLVVNDTVLRGVSGNAGEVGGLDASCTTRDLAEEGVRRGVLTGLSLPVSPTEAEDALVDLVRIAHDGDAEARDIIDGWARRVGRGVAAAATLVDAPLIIFGGPAWTLLAERFLPIVREIVDASPFVEKTRETVVTTSALGDAVGAIGAASLVLDTLLSVQPQSLVLQ
ncbi:ROK family transcriptional regulator [Mycetocola sp. JXN-3]|uniref:ROK family transcriptional regulator n=1 Tax=Mycetocola sp. JXN-3 TaxID=2116510 RepID=UPI00165CF672|nr:ROK family transcriptional regulator [Mycetocola sp. JXN-3]